MSYDRWTENERRTLFNYLLESGNGLAGAQIQQEHAQRHVLAGRKHGEQISPIRYPNATADLRLANLPKIPDRLP